MVSVVDEASSPGSNAVPNTNSLVNANDVILREVINEEKTAAIGLILEKATRPWRLGLYREDWETTKESVSDADDDKEEEELVSKIWLTLYLNLFFIFSTVF